MTSLFGSQEGPMKKRLDDWKVDMGSLAYTILRFLAMLKKEFIIVRRDLRTYLFLIIIPFAEVILFGFIISTEPKHMPTIVLVNDYSQFTNSLIQAFKGTGYFAINRITENANEAEELIRSGKVQFIITIPQNFSRDLIRGRQPHLLVEGDASDPLAVGAAFHAASLIPDTALERDLTGPLNYLPKKNNSFAVSTHAKYNPATISQYHTLPGLIITILTVSLVILTTVSITSEYEHGTMETLLVTPIRPLEAVLGKIIPHIVLAYILFTLTLLAAYWIFHVPFFGSVLLLYVVAFPFLIATLGIGLAASSISRSQFQAINIANMYNIPSLLFSGFMFPFYAMPVWAQKIGILFPSTHFLRIMLNVMLKDSGFSEIWPDVWPILLFMVFIIFICFKYYRETLD